MTGPTTTRERFHEDDTPDANVVTLAELLFVVVHFTHALDLNLVKASPEAAALFVDACTLAEQKARQCLDGGDEAHFGASNASSLLPSLCTGVHRVSTLTFISWDTFTASWSKLRKSYLKLACIFAVTRISTALAVRLKREHGQLPDGTYAELTDPVTIAWLQGVQTEALALQQLQEPDQPHVLLVEPNDARLALHVSE
jgi:hypothetical protein